MQLSPLHATLRTNTSRRFMRLCLTNVCMVGEKKRRAPSRDCRDAKHVGFSPTRQASLLIAPSANRREGGGGGSFKHLTNT
ncbi:unnamed protein product [Laminaria digitata]